MPQPMHHTNARLYLPEIKRLFTQLWASLQSGEADGGVDWLSRSSIRLCKWASNKIRNQPMGR